MTSVTVAGAAVAVAGIGIARIMPTGVLGLGFAPTTATGAATGLLLPTTTSVALLEALLFLAIAAIHAMAAGLAATSVSASMPTSTVARTTALALADGADWAALALAGRNNGRKERWKGGIDGRVATATAAWRVVATTSSSSATGRIVALAFARRVVTFALASASALSFATLALALAFAFSLAASKVLDEDVVAVAYRLAFDDASGLLLLHGGILSREGVELPTVGDVGTELGGVVGRHIMMVMIILVGIGKSRST